MTVIESGPHRFEWYATGYELLEAQLQAIRGARSSIRMETYIWADDDTGRAFRRALIEAGGRGVRVTLLVDAVGGMELRRDYFAELAALPGCAMKWFNELSLATWSFRDHRKLLVVDDEAVCIGGCNIAEVYHGDGVDKGWRDGGMRIEGPVVADFAAEFDSHFATARDKQWQVVREAKKRGKPQATPSEHGVKALFIRPGFGNNPLRAAVREDLKSARDICVTSAYFLPASSMRRRLRWAVARGARLRLLLGGKTDVRLMQLATRSLYRKMLRAGMHIHEYQPQVLHAKMLVIDDVVYLGSSNLDPRSLRINFEVMVRVHCAELARVAREQFEADLKLSQEVTPEACLKAGLWTRLQQRLARWLLGRLDPEMSAGMLRRLQLVR